MEKKTKIWEFLNCNTKFGWKEWVVYSVVVLIGYFVGKFLFNGIIGAIMVPVVLVAILYLYWFITKKV